MPPQPPTGSKTGHRPYLPTHINSPRTPPSPTNRRRWLKGSGMGANVGFGMGGDQTGLNSHAARMGFAQAAQLQQQQHPHQQSHAMGGDH
ncbi:CAF1-domain-containing protein [Apiospora kogelbergensis]|uniref:CAF1-domain-containing protein n=1 Tax=Apiospora kogelbergensis TaxID=1337665 RepID=UPI00312ECB2E